MRQSHGVCSRKPDALEPYGARAQTGRRAPRQVQADWARTGGCARKGTPPRPVGDPARSPAPTAPPWLRGSSPSRTAVECWDRTSGLPVVATLRSNSQLDGCRKTSWPSLTSRSSQRGSRCLATTLLTCPPSASKNTRQAVPNSGTLSSAMQRSVSSTSNDAARRLLASARNTACERHAGGSVEIEAAAVRAFGSDTGRSWWRVLG